MLQYARRKTGGGFNLVRNAHGSVNRLMRNKTAGYGMGGDMMMEKAASVAPQLPTGENKITSRVSVTFEIK